VSLLFVTTPLQRLTFLLYVPLYEVAADCCNTMRAFRRRNCGSRASNHDFVSAAPSMSPSLP